MFERKQYKVSTLEICLNSGQKVLVDNVLSWEIAKHKETNRVVKLTVEQAKNHFNTICYLDVEQIISVVEIRA